MKYKMTLAYEGTSYGGWQIQKNAPTIQEEVETALKILLKEGVSLVGSGRTDAGVHALGQVAHFVSPCPLDPYRILYALNALLPSAIRILSLEATPDHFHARYSALAKIYHYHLYLQPITDPFRRGYVYSVPYPVNRELIKEAASYFVGKHDFTSFANGSDHKDAVREIYRLDCKEEEGGLWLEFEGSGFLYKMVRNIVGTLLDVGRGKLKGEQIGEILEKKERSFAGSAAPPQGLFLVEVKY